jgi:hypothetical protein
MTKYWVKVKDAHGRFSDHSFDSEVERTLFEIKAQVYGGIVIQEWEAD